MKKIISIIVCCLFVFNVFVYNGTVAHAEEVVSPLTEKIAQLNEKNTAYIISYAESQGEQFVMLEYIDNSGISPFGLNQSTSSRNIQFYHVNSFLLQSGAVLIAEAETKLNYTSEHFNDGKNFVYNYVLNSISGKITMRNANYRVDECSADISAIGFRQSISGTPTHVPNEIINNATLSLNTSGNFNYNTGFSYYHNNAFFGGIISSSYRIIFANVSNGVAAYSLSFTHMLPANNGNLS